MAWMACAPRFHSERQVLQVLILWRRIFILPRRSGRDGNAAQRRKTHGRKKWTKADCPPQLNNQAAGPKQRKKAASCLSLSLFLSLSGSANRDVLGVKQSTAAGWLLQLCHASLSLSLSRPRPRACPLVSCRVVSCRVVSGCSYS